MRQEIGFLTQWTSQGMGMEGKSRTPEQRSCSMPLLHKDTSDEVYSSVGPRLLRLRQLD